MSFAKGFDVMEAKDCRILHVIECLDDSYGGPAKSVPILCDHLRRNGYNCRVISIEDSDASNEFVDRYSLEWLYCRSFIFKRFYFSFSFIWLCARQVALSDIVHFHSIWTFPTLIGFLCCKIFRKRYVVSPRSSLMKASMNNRYRLKKLLTFLYIERFVRGASVIVASSEEEGNDLRSLFELDAKIVANRLDSNDLAQINRGVARDILALPIDCTLLSFISRIHPRKGLHHLVDIWSSRAQGLPLHLMVCGPIEDRAYFDDILAIIEKKGLINQFHYLGVVNGENRLAAFNAGDLFVLPTEFENFGMSIAESMLCGVPVLTTIFTPWEGINGKAGWCVEFREFGAVLDVALGSDLVSVGRQSKQYIEDFCRNFENEDVWSEIYLNIFNA